MSRRGLIPLIAAAPPSLPAKTAARQMCTASSPGHDRLFATTGRGDLALLIGVGTTGDYLGVDDGVRLVFHAHERAGRCKVGSQVTLIVRISLQVEVLGRETDLLFVLVAVVTQHESAAEREDGVILRNGRARPIGLLRQGPQRAYGKVAVCRCENSAPNLSTKGSEQMETFVPLIFPVGMTGPVTMNGTSTDALYSDLVRHMPCLPSASCDK